MYSLSVFSVMSCVISLGIMFIIDPGQGATITWPLRRGGWWDVTDSVGLGIEFPYRALATVDWNGDKTADIIFTSTDNASVLIYLWYQSSFSLTYKFTFLSQSDWPDSKLEIISGVSGDINRDGLPDLMVATSDGKLSIIYGVINGSGTVHRDVLKGTGITLHKTQPHLNILNLHGYCALLDLVVSTIDGSVYVLKNKLRDFTNQCDFIGGSVTFEPIEITKGGFNKENADDRAAISRTGTGSVDFTGKCHPGFITPNSVQKGPNGIRTVLYKVFNEVSSNGGVDVTHTFYVPSFVGRPMFADVNSDGAIDIVFPSCIHESLSPTNESCKRYDAILILYNDIKRQDPCSTSNCCKGHPSHFASVYYNPTKLSVVSDKGFSNGKFVQVPINCNSFIPKGYNVTNDDGSIFQTSSKLKKGRSVQGVRLINTERFPAMSRMVDLDCDKYSDILLSTELGPMLLMNNGGDDGEFTCKPLDESRLKNYKKNEEYMNSIIFGYSLADDGLIDIVAFSISPRGGTWAYFNALPNDVGYSLSATVTNGVKGDITNYPSWGAVQIGAVHRFQWQDINTQIHSASMTQLATSSGHALMLPNSYFGLGRTFSYVQNYATGVFVSGVKTTYIQWSAYLIPNSRVVILAHPIDNPYDWDIMLFLYPLRSKEVLMIGLGTALMMVGIPIVVLKCKEIQHDRGEKRKQLR